MIRVAIPLLALALAACSGPDTGTDGSETDFAARVGAGSATTGAAQPPAPVVSTAVKGPPPAGADVLAPEKLGDIGGVDLGPRAGGCTFSEQGTELLIAAGPADRALPGKGVVRIGGKLIALDTPPGGIEAIRGGTSFVGEGFTVRVQPTGPGKGVMTITKASGETKRVAGDYVCA
jgi:hypothetical protein